MIAINPAPIRAQARTVTVPLINQKLINGERARNRAWPHGNPQTRTVAQLTNSNRDTDTGYGRRRTIRVALSVRDRERPRLVRIAEHREHLNW